MDDDAVDVGKPFPCDGRCRDPNGGLTSGGPPAAPMIADPVLLPVGIVRVARTKRVDEIAVVLAPRVFIADQQRDRRARGFAFKEAGEDLDPVGFLALSDMPRRP